MVKLKPVDSSLWLPNRSVARATKVWAPAVSARSIVATPLALAAAKPNSLPASNNRTKEPLSVWVVKVRPVVLLVIKSEDESPVSSSAANCGPCGVAACVSRRTVSASEAAEGTSL